MNAKNEKLRRWGRGMHGLIREENSFGANPGTKDLAKHLYARMYYGKVVVVANRPLTVLSQLRKQWLKLARKVQKERASTLNAVRIREFSDILTHMHNLQFTFHYPPDEYPASVYIVTPEEILRWPPECRTMYVTCDVSAENLHMMTAWMPPISLVVMCKLAYS